MNVMDFCTAVPDDPTVDWIVDSSSMYPAMVAMLKAIGGNEDTPAAKDGLAAIQALDAERYTRESAMVLAGELTEVTPNPIHRMYMPRVRRVSSQGWVLALQSLSDDMSDAEKAERAEALSLARLIFTEMLQQTLGGGSLSLRLSRDLTYRIRE